MTKRERFVVITAFTLLGVVLFSGLGAWQLGRAQQKQAAQALLELQAARPPVDGEDLLGALTADWTRRPARLRGIWLPEQQIWLDNRTHDRRAGTLLVTPLRLLPSGPVVWVQRGWRAREPGQHGVPPWPITAAGSVEVEGHLMPNASQAYALGPEGTGPLRQNLDLSASARALGQPVLPWVLWQDRDCAPLACDWPAPESGVHKHWGYAAQWFALAALLLGLYVWFQFIQPRRTRA